MNKVGMFERRTYRQFSNFKTIEDFDQSLIQNPDYYISLQRQATSQPEEALMSVCVLNLTK
jgi:hypothetical protein